MRKITAIAGAAGTKLRDRSRNVKLRVLEIGRAARAKGGAGREKMTRAYRRLLDATGREVGQAKRFAKEIAEGIKCAPTLMKHLALDGLRAQLDDMVPLVRQVIRQTKARIIGGDIRAEGKIVSLFEPSTEIIRKGKAGKPTEFGKMVKLQEAENQIVTEYEVYDRRPNDCDLLTPAIDTHIAVFDRAPHLLAADAAFYSGKNERAAKRKGVRRVCIPNRATKSRKRKREQKKPWFRNGQRWRTGCEGRISVVKRRHSRRRTHCAALRWPGRGAHRPPHARRPEEAACLRTRRGLDVRHFRTGYCSVGHCWQVRQRAGLPPSRGRRGRSRLPCELGPLFRGRACSCQRSADARSWFSRAEAS